MKIEIERFIQYLTCAFEFNSIKQLQTHKKKEFFCFSLKIKSSLIDLLTSIIW